MSASTTAQPQATETDVPWLEPIEDRAWRGLRRIDLLVLGAIARDLHADSQLSEADYQVLTNVSEADDHQVRFRELATRMQWSTSRLSHQLARMERRQLIQRQDHPEDGRGSNVTLTPHGHAIVTEAAPHHVRSVRRHLFDALSPAQVRHLADIAETLTAHHATSDRGRP